MPVYNIKIALVAASCSETGRRRLRGSRILRAPVGQGARGLQRRSRARGASGRDEVAKAKPAASSSGSGAGLSGGSSTQRTSRALPKKKVKSGSSTARAGKHADVLLPGEGHTAQQLQEEVSPPSVLDKLDPSQPGP